MANSGYLLAIAALLGLALFMVNPVLGSGYSGDDVQNHQIPMRMRESGMSAWDTIVVTNEYWMEGYGRFFPMSTAETVAIFVLLPTRLAYKVFQVAMVLVNIALFVVTVTTLTRQRAAGVLAGGLAVAALQIRIFHDPILQFSAQQQILVALLLATMLLFHLALDRHQPWLLLPALVVWAAALTTYETMYCVAPVFAVLLLLSNASFRERATALAVIVVPVAALIAFVMDLRSKAPPRNAPQYTFNFEPSRVIPTLYNQMSAALPGNYGLQSGSAPPPSLDDKWQIAGVADIAVFILAVLVIGIAAMRLRWVGWRVPTALVIAGLGIWTGPAAVVAVTQSWQDKLRPGIAYVSVYVEYFGMAMVGVGLVMGIVGLCRTRVLRIVAVVPLALSLGAGSAYAIERTGDFNDIAVGATSGYRWNRGAFEEGIKHGVLDPIPPGSLLVPLDTNAWVNSAFVFYYGGPRLRVGPVLPVTPCAAPSGACTASAPEWAAVHGGNGTAAVAVAGTFVAPRLLPQNTPDALSSDVYAFVEGSDLDPATVMTTAEWTPSPAEPVVRRPLTPAERTIVASGKGWVLLHLRPATGLLSLQALRHDIV